MNSDQIKKMYQLQKKEKAFTLVELAIVLVIVGLLIAGILVGQDLIRQSRLNAVLNDLNRFQVAVIIFQDKYKGLPGDFQKGVPFFGKGNGNNNGCIDHTTNEAWTSWYHLSQAKLIKGEYTGEVGSGGGYHIEVGVNAPKDSDKTGYSFDPWYNGSNCDNNIFYGSELRGWPVWEASISGAEGYLIDTKFDDGNAVLGKIRGLSARNLSQTFYSVGITGGGSTTARSWVPTSQTKDAIFYYKFEGKSN